MQVGNALLDFTIDFNSADEYKWSHGLISDDDYQFLTKSCNGSAEIIRKALNQEADTKCLVVYVRVNQQLAKTIDPYDVTGDVCLSTVKSQMDMLYEPLLSKSQTLLPLHSKPNALNQQANAPFKTIFPTLHSKPNALNQQVNFLRTPVKTLMYCDLFLSHFYI